MASWVNFLPRRTTMLLCIDKSVVPQHKRHALAWTEWLACASRTEKNASFNVRCQKVPTLNSNLTKKPFKLLSPDVSTITIRRSLAGKGIDAQISIMAEKLQQLSVASPAQSEHPHGQKRKRGLEEEKDVGDLADGIKQLRCDEVLSKGLWKLFDEVVWQKRGFLYGRWRFDG